MAPALLELPEPEPPEPESAVALERADEVDEDEGGTMTVEKLVD